MKVVGFVFLLTASLVLLGRNASSAPSGQVVTWGENLAYPGPPNYFSTGLVAIAGQVLTNAIAVSAGSSHGLALRSDGAVVGWGASIAGEAMGLRSMSATNGQVHLAGGLLTNVIAISGGRRNAENFSLALQGNGHVVGWGENRERQTAIPTSLTNVIAIAAGARQGLALRADGTIASWGEGNPPPGGLTNIVAIAAGGDSGRNMALRGNSTVVDWPALSADYSPTVPGGLTDVVAIAAGGGHCLALRRDGTVVGWGVNSYGQATGNPTSSFRDESTGTVQVAGQTLSNITAIAAANEFSLGLKKDGTVVAWGHPFSMEMNVPEGLSNVVAISAGDRFGLAITTNFTQELGRPSVRNQQK
jgi:alpha-tubulin suppressor-like RCC1 family protein